MKTLIALAIASLLVWTTNAATGEENLSPSEARELGDEVWRGRPSVFKICPPHGGSRDYALCAAAQCFTIDDVAYCKCEKKHGQSISLPFFFPAEEAPLPGPEPVGDVCDLIDISGEGSFLVSTFSPPPQLQQSYEGPDPLAIYTCPGAANLSAQCDGGLCGRGSSGTAWPFLEDIGPHEVVCSCPIAGAPGVGFQFLGPADCDRDFYDQYCGVRGGGSDETSVPTGTRLAVGAVTGTGTILTKLLLGSVPPTNRCFFEDPDDMQERRAIRGGDGTLPHR